MGRKATAIILTSEEREYLKSQTRSRTIQAQTVCRARILLLKAEGVAIDVIADKVGINRCSVMLCLKKFKEGGVENADIKPNKIKYHCRKRDPDFDQKMHNVLLVYKHLSMQFDEDGQLLPFAKDGQIVHVLSYDEKPGIQATANTSEDLPPDENHKTFSRDYEYKRLGTISLLAGIDLQTGEAIPLVKDRHTSKEYIEFLKLLDSKYCKEDKIRLVLDNLKVHTSEETKNILLQFPEDLNLYLLQNTVHG